MRKQVFITPEILDLIIKQIMTGLEIQDRLPKSFVAEINRNSKEKKKLKEKNDFFNWKLIRSTMVLIPLA